MQTSKIIVTPLPWNFPSKWNWYNFLELIYKITKLTLSQMTLRSVPWAEFFHNGPWIKKKKEDIAVQTEKVCLVKKLTLNVWSQGEQWILFPKNLNVYWDEVEGNIEIWGFVISSYGAFFIFLYYR